MTMGARPSVERTRTISWRIPLRVLHEVERIADAEHLSLNRVVVQALERQLLRQSATP